MKLVINYWIRTQTIESQVVEEKEKDNCNVKIGKERLVG